MERTATTLFWLLLAVFFFPLRCESRCRGCDLALASYYIRKGQNLTGIAALFGIAFGEIDSTILPYNKNIPNKDVITMNTTIDIPFQCDCINGEFLGRSFPYTTNSGDTYATIAAGIYRNLTTVDILRQTNAYDVSRIPLDVEINVTVKCFCGDEQISRDYGLFVTYPLRAGDTLESVARSVGFSDTNLLQRFNSEINFSGGEGIVYVPRSDANGSFRPLQRTAKTGLSPGAVAGISLAGVAFVVCLSVSYYYIAKKRKRSSFLLSSGNLHANGGGDVHQYPGVEVNSSLGEIRADKSVEYSYEELAKATDNFNMVNKIGEGGFGAVYYAELRGEEEEFERSPALLPRPWPKPKCLYGPLLRAAIKKMAMQATKEFLAELNVLTRVHHVNLLRLMGYCTEGSLFLVYEYIDNGNLSQHLRSSSGKDLAWPIRVKIALDSARGLEYIHDHTVQLYIHRDVKSANILIDKNFHAKVADFGLAKLTKVGDASLQSKAAGTFGYMSPEYARYGELSPKVDVYAFGVVLYELVSGRPAIVKLNNGTDSRGLIDLFEDVFAHPDPITELPRLIDPNLGTDYHIDSVYQMAQLARICTQEEAQLRPDMREVVVALMTLSSSTAGWDIGALFGNPALLNLMSGR